MLEAINLLFAGEGYHCLKGLTFERLSNGKEVTNRRFNIARYHHSLGLPLELLWPHDLLQEVADHDIRFDPDGFFMSFHIGPQLLLSLGAVKQRVISDRFLDLVVALVGGVIGQDVEDETLLDSLLH